MRKLKLSEKMSNLLTAEEEEEKARKGVYSPVKSETDYALVSTMISGGEKAVSPTPKSKVWGVLTLVALGIFVSGVGCLAFILLN